MNQPSRLNIIERSQAHRPPPPGTTPEGSAGWGCLVPIAVAAFILVLVTVDWLVIFALAASAVAWRTTSAKGGPFERALHRLAESWGIALSILAVLEMLVFFIEPDGAEPVLSAYERTVLEAARLLSRSQLDWGWLLVVLAVLMAIAIVAPRLKPVTGFLAASRRTGQVVGVLTILSTFSFFTTAVAPRRGKVVLHHAQALFDSSLAREQDALRRLAVARALTTELEKPGEAVRLLGWAETIGETLHMEENQNELIRDLVGSEPPSIPEGEPRDRLLLSDAVTQLTDQEARVEAAEGELDRGFREILAKTADLPRKEIVNGVLERLVQALGDHPSLVVEAGKALISNLAKEAWRDRTQPVAERLVAGLRQRFWQKHPAIYTTELQAEAERIKRVHAERAESLMTRALSLAERADRRVYADPYAARSDAREAQEAGAQAKSEAARAADRGANGGLLSSSVFGGFGLERSPIPDLDAKLRELDRTMERVHQVEVRAKEIEVRRIEARRVRVP